MQRLMERARVAADEAIADVINDCSVDKKRDDCKSEVVRRRKVIRVRAAIDETIVEAND